MFFSADEIFLIADYSSPSVWRDFLEDASGSLVVLKELESQIDSCFVTEQLLEIFAVELVDVRYCNLHVLLI